MKKVERVGISLDKKLLSKFDKLISRQGYQSRSEAVRDLIREQLSTEQLEDAKAGVVAVVCLFLGVPVDYKPLDIIACVFLMITLISGIAALVKIKLSKGLLTGKGYMLSQGYLYQCFSYFMD